MLTANRKLAFSRQINCRSEKQPLLVKVVLLSVYSAKAKQKAYVLNGEGVFIDQVKLMRLEVSFAIIRMVFRWLRKIDTDVRRTADAIFEQYHCHCSQNSILTVKKSFYNDKHSIDCSSILVCSYSIIS